MIAILNAILCAIQTVAASIIDLLMMALNGIIVAIAAAIGAFVALLPAMPAPPDAPSSGILAWLNFFIPLGGFVIAAIAAFVLWGLWMLVATGLRWLKAVE